MSSIYVGDTIKITGTGRHPEADALLLDHVDLRDATVVDLGASDGSTSLELLRRLPTSTTFVLADLYLHLDAYRTGRRTMLFDPSGACVLVSGPRILAWPSLSPRVRRLYRRSITRARQNQRTSVLLLNPELRHYMRDNPRVSYREHDIFTTWTGPRPDAIKVANLLRRLYFTDDAIRAALVTLHADLPDGGHLLIVDNPRIPGVRHRAALYRKEKGRFVRRAISEQEPEIDDLVTAIGAA